jgi:hypothetical protein
LQSYLLCIWQEVHKALKNIFNNQIGKTPPRIQSFMMFLQKYNFNIDYISSTSDEMKCTDTLSRAPVNDMYDPELSETELNAQIHQIITNLPVTNNKLQTIRLETEKDQTLQRLRHHIQNGWPTSHRKLRDDTKPFFNVRHELNTVEGLILKGSRIVIPKSLIADMKKQLHHGHLGIERTKDNARNSIYWPRIDADITDVIENCNACQQHRNKQQKETLIFHNMPPKA